MKSLYPILLIHLLAVNVFGQHKILPVHPNRLFEAPLTGESCQLKRTIGSQLFHDDWFTGDVILISGDTVSNKEIGYNAYTDEILWRPVKTVQIRLDREQIDRFCIYDRKNNGVFSFCHLQGILLPENRNIDLFARILSENKLSLFVTYPVECIEKIEQQSQGKIIYIEKLEDSKPCYYIGLTDKKYVALNGLRKKSLYRAFPDYEKEIKSLLNQYHLPLRNENDLIRIVELLNQSEIIKISDSERVN
jgi:hypothetical protein